MIAQPELAGKVSPPLDDLLLELYCQLDDRLPAQRLGRPQATTDAELLTLAVAQILLDCPAERVWLRRAGRRLGHLFPRLPSRSQYNKRLRQLGPALTQAIAILAAGHPAAAQRVLLIDSTPLPAAASVPTVQRSELAGSATHGFSVSHTRWYWGFKLILAAAPDGFPLAFELVPANRSEQDARWRSRGRSPARPASAGSTPQATRRPGPDSDGSDRSGRPADPARSTASGEPA
jgi:hypothetical protein